MSDLGPATAFPDGVPVSRAWPVWGTFIWVLASMACFGVSLMQPGYVTEGSTERLPGGFMLVMGWITVLYGQLVWVANPLLLMAWLFPWAKNSTPISAVFALAALGVAAMFLLQGEIVTNEAGDTRAIVDYGPAYWWWLLSMGVAVTGSLCQCVVTVLGSRRQEA